MCRADFPYLQNSGRLFFLTLKVIASSTQFFTIFEHFNIQKRKEKVDINPNLKKQNKDDNFDMKF